MKKVLFLLACFFQVTMVSAQTLYGTETHFSDYQEERMESRLDNQIEATIFYQLYRVERINGPYHTLDFEDSTYPFIDKKESIMSGWTDWSEAQVDVKEGRKIEERIAYQVQRLKQVRYFYLFDVSGGKDNFQISEMSFYVNGNKLDVHYECETCSIGYEDIIQNGVAKEQPFAMENGGMIKVDLQGSYFMEDIKVVLALYDEGYDQKDYKMAFDYRSTLEDDPYYNTSVVSAFTYSNYSQIEASEYTSKYFVRPKLEWDYFITPEKVKEDEYTTVTPIIQRRYQDTLYRFYKETIEKTKAYYQYPTSEYPYVDYESAKVFYREKITPMIVINENASIYQKGDLEKELILFSNVSYEIVEAIDYEKNGFYEVEVVTDFSNTKYLVELKIPENEVTQYENQIQILEREKAWIQEENQRLSDLLFEKEEEKKMLATTIQNLKQEIQTLKEDGANKENLISKLAEYEQKEKELELEIASLKNKKSSLESEIQVLENQLSMVSNQTDLWTEIKDKVEFQGNLIEKLKEEDEKTQQMIETYQKKNQKHYMFSWILVPVFFFTLLLSKKR